MRFIDRLNLAQRIVVIVSFGLALAAVGGYIVNLGGSAANFGWFGYAPLTQVGAPLGPDLSLWEQLLVWLGLIALWAAGSLVVLRPKSSGSRQPHA